MTSENPMDQPDSRHRMPAGVRARHAIGAVLLCVAGCAVGPNYQRPAIAVPDHFKEGVEWQRAQPGVAAALSGTWWQAYRDDELDRLVEQALQANQSIVEAEAAYRIAQASVQSNAAALFPVVSAGLSATRSGAGPGVPAAASSRESGAYNLVSATATASWEPDLWGSVRRSIASAKASAQASDAQLAGVRLSIAASVVSDYFALRAADVDIHLLDQERDIDAHLLKMTQASYRVGEASNDDVLAAQDTLEAAIAALQSAATSREQDEHALAVLAGVPPAAFAIAPRPSYAFSVPPVPLALPSQLLERRYDVVSAERTAAAANERIGVAEAAFFPSLDLSAEGGFEHNAFANLLTVPNRLWTLGPDLAATLFDGGARRAAVASARATYDEDVASYRNTVLAAFQSVEDALSSMYHLGAQAHAYAGILQGNQKLFDSARAQLQAGAQSQQDVLTAQLTLLQAQQNLVDTRAALSESSVTLIKNLGGGWQWDGAHARAARQAAQAASAPATAAQ
jgi:NodT family efflux transporter outer membrane factor (OMF) lipoprotein